MSFFDTTPLGRILNRFSKDIYTIDESIPRSVRAFLMTFFSVISTLIVIVIATPILLAVIAPLGVVYFLIQVLGCISHLDSLNEPVWVLSFYWCIYVATSRQLKRLESISRSPIYSHFQETVMGVASIRAYHQQDRFILGSEERVDYNQIAYYPSICANRCVSVPSTYCLFTKGIDI